MKFFRKLSSAGAALLLALCLVCCTGAASDDFDLSEVPGYSGEPYMEINGNVPYFTVEDLTAKSYETYSDLDSLGRCGAATACVGTDLMPTQERGSIYEVRPSGWHSTLYEGLVDGDSLYNRCHLIAYMLTAEDANERNLITGTRYLNTEGMLPFEEQVADYVKETQNHVLYRVTPVFDGDDLVARGVLMEAMSVEDDGASVLFNVYCYNVQPGVVIDYATGESRLSETAAVTEETSASGIAYILNSNTQKFHYPTCESVKDISDSHREEYAGDRADLIARGYAPCKRCEP